MMKWDGHTHSQFCRHGKQEDTYKMVEKAIEYNFEQYSIVEHAPLPEDILKEKKLLPELGLMKDEVAQYFAHLDDLKAHYRDKIKILKGLEIDFISSHVDYTKNLVADLKNQLEDVVFSIHFLPSKREYLAVDYTPEDYLKGLIKEYGSAEEVHKIYWSNMKQLITTDFGLPKSRRIGHLALIYKFFDYLPQTSAVTIDPNDEEELFRLIKIHGWALDFNVAGFDQKYWQRPYFTESMLFWVRKFEIPLVYGSDAHGINDVGRYYDRYLAAV